MSPFKSVCNWLVLSLSLVASATSAEEAKLRVGWVYAMANAPAIIAQEKGFFRQANVAVELRRFNSGPLIMNALKAGDLDMAYIGMPPVYHAYEKGMDIRICAKVNYGQAAMIVNQESAIQSLQDLRGKRIAGVRKGSGMDVLLRGFVLRDQAGLDPQTDVQIINMPAKMMEASVERKVVDAAFTWEPFVSIALLTREARIIFDMNKAVPQYPWYVIVGRASVLQAQRAAVEKMLQAHARAINYLNTELDASNGIIAREFNVHEIVASNGSKVTAEQVIRAARERLGWDRRFADQDRQFLQRLINYSHELGFIQHQIDASELIDATFDF